MPIMWAREERGNGMGKRSIRSACDRATITSGCLLLQEQEGRGPLLDERAGVSAQNDPVLYLAERSCGINCES
jgi:hypothetical protein